MRIEEMVHNAKDAQREERSQVVHIPAHLQGRRGSDHHITRRALVKGSCAVRSSYLPLGKRPAECGIVTSYGRRSAVVRERGEDHWEAVEAEPERPHQWLQAALLGGGNT
jgi:hypothetical protein